ncbi:peroxidase-related enzyme [Edaphobacter paludis]|uniref:Peroxidase-related enzyme n=1 Tax=Edaphobacter paludis TaxID=3035702 RepID=A0AAU7D4J3_9BACT
MSTLETALADIPYQSAPTLAVVEEDVATGAVARVYADYRTRFGREHVPGILKCFATHPPLLEQMLAIASDLLFVEGHLPRRTKEMIATYVSALNACPYCLDSHASFLHQQGGSERLLLALFTGDLTSPSLTVNERGLLNFVAKVTDESYKISRADIASLQDAGWREPQIAETVHITALFSCFNRVANTFGLASQQLFDVDLSQARTEENL